MCNWGLPPIVLFCPKIRHFQAEKCDCAFFSWWAYRLTLLLSQNSKAVLMFGHYLKIAIRNIAKYKTQSIIVILSIALGMVFCSLTLMWIRYERSYDSFHRDAEDIYLLMSKKPNTAGEDFSAYSSYPEGAYLAEKYPQIKEYTRCSNGVLNRVFAEGKMKIFSLFLTSRYWMVILS